LRLAIARRCGDAQQAFRENLVTVFVAICPRNQRRIKNLRFKSVVSCLARFVHGKFIAAEPNIEGSPVCFKFKKAFLLFKR